mmetsp:Transcript_22305/g.39963  ORF Transcript_22305/g.39963 Transcript_22305/m.39963 type:complete len:84 (+) Transcript_22305:1338-1589(+)
MDEAGKQASEQAEGATANLGVSSSAATELCPAVLARFGGDQRTPKPCWRGETASREACRRRDNSTTHESLHHLPRSWTATASD